jgi:hypothetical protein
VRAGRGMGRRRDDARGVIRINEPTEPGAPRGEDSSPWEAADRPGSDHGVVKLLWWKG